MEEIRSGSILKSVPEDLRPRPEQKALQVAKIDVKNETIQEKSKPKKVIRLSQVQLIESDSEEEDALSLKVGIKNAQTSFDTFTSQKMSHRKFHRYHSFFRHHFHSRKKQTFILLRV